MLGLPLAWGNQMPAVQGDKLRILLWYSRCCQSGGSFSNLLTVIKPASAKVYMNIYIYEYLKNSLPLVCAVEGRTCFAVLYTMDEFATCTLFPYDFQVLPDFYYFYYYSEAL